MNIKLPKNIKFDETTLDQIETFKVGATSRAYKDIVIMPDAHMGKGSCIGFTAKIDNGVIPQTVGVDIGCGMSSFVISGKKKNDFKNIVKNNLTTLIEERIPSGFHVNETVSEKLEKELPKVTDLKLISNPNYNQVLKDNFSNKQGVGLSSFIESKFKTQIGSLGGGNHFIELSESGNNIMWTVHSGSRFIGAFLAEIYQTIANEKYEGLLPKDSIEFEDYLHDVTMLKEYAKKNRKEMLDRLLKISENIIEKPKTIKYIDTPHNYVDVDDMVVRKGAIRGFNNKELIIPWNMKDGISIVKIKENIKDTNNSLPHGAGRVSGRQAAFRNLNIKEAEKNLEGFVSSRSVIEVLDENPLVYKDPNIVKNWIKENYDCVIDDYKTIYNFKAAEHNQKRILKQLKRNKSYKQDNYLFENGKIIKKIKTPHKKITL